MRKTILVTGAAGFIGSFLCEELVKHGYLVIGIDNFFRGKIDNVNTLKKDSFVLYQLDLSRTEEVIRLKEIIVQHNVEVVFHLAAINGTQYFYDEPLFVLDQNIRITQNLLSAIAETSVDYLIYTSSSEVYGEPINFPTSEEELISLNTDANRDSYAASKAIDEFYIRLHAEKLQINCLLLRVFNLYGEKMVGTRYGQVIPEFITRILTEHTFTILGDGKNTRSFCYIKDATWAMRQLMEKNITGLVNLGNDEEVSILDLAKLIHRLENVPFNPQFLPGRPDDHDRRRPDINLLKSLLPQLSFTDLTQGLRKVVHYYKGIIPAVLKRIPQNPILKPNANNTWETSAVFNSAAIYLEKKVHLIYRAITADGQSVLGYASSNDGITISERSAQPVYLIKDVMARSLFDLETPSLFSYQSGYSWVGCEDPRLARIGDTIFMTYTVLDNRNPPYVGLTSIAVTDFLHKRWNWRKAIQISPLKEQHKNWVIFPEKIKGQYAILHSLSPNVLIEYIPKLEHHHSISINSYYCSQQNSKKWDNWMRGAGPPPIKTPYGWLVLYHAMDCNDPNRYKIGAMLLDLKNPEKILYRTSHPILEPNAIYENEGYKQGVVYACGAVVIKNRLIVYYGAADTVLCAASMEMNALLKTLKK